jgi:hypothetical protein
VVVACALFLAVTAMKIDQSTLQLDRRYDFTCFQPMIHHGKENSYSLFTWSNIRMHLLCGKLKMTRLSYIYYSIQFISLFYDWDMLLWISKNASHYCSDQIHMSKQKKIKSFPCTKTTIKLSMNFALIRSFSIASVKFIIQ